MINQRRTFSFRFIVLTSGFGAPASACSDVSVVAFTPSSWSSIAAVGILHFSERSVFQDSLQMLNPGDWLEINQKGTQAATSGHAGRCSDGNPPVLLVISTRPADAPHPVAVLSEMAISIRTAIQGNSVICYEGRSGCGHHVEADRFGGIANRGGRAAMGAAHGDRPALQRISCVRSCHGLREDDRGNGHPLGT